MFSNRFGYVCTWPVGHDDAKPPTARVLWPTSSGGHVSGCDAIRVDHPARRNPSTGLCSRQFLDGTTLVDDARRVAKSLMTLRRAASRMSGSVVNVCRLVVTGAM